MMSQFARLTRVVLVGCTAAILMSCGGDDDDSPLSGPTQISSDTPTVSITAPEPSGPLSVSVAWEVVAPTSVVAGHNQESYRFTANVTGGVAPYTYRWSFGDGTEPVEGNPVVHKFYSPGTYAVVVRVRDAAGTVIKSDSSEDLQIEIVASPFSLSCHVSPTEGEAPLEVTLRAEPTGNVGPITWSWDFGDGSGSDERIASHVYDPQGYAGKARLTAMATATDGQGRSVQCSREIMVSVPTPAPPAPVCLRTWTSSCISGLVEAMAIGPDGCLTGATPTAGAPGPGNGSAQLFNQSPDTHTTQFLFVGAGFSGSFALAPGASASFGFSCPPGAGPVRLSW